MGKLIDLTGRRFGHLSVIKCAGRDKYKRGLWECRCDCGATVIVQSGNLRTGNSAGCALCRSERQKVHGGHGSRLYNIWGHMLSRCGDPKNDKFGQYGGRGIRVCDEWRDFVAFQKWALANGYSDKLTIDRINVNGDYAPENCRWATQTEQMRNTRKNHLIYGHCISEWAELALYPISQQVLSGRLHLGWSLTRALTTPKRGAKNDSI